jgi:regulator of replication initiation timing
MLDKLNPQLIQDVEGARQAIVYILNIVEELKTENTALREENQRLRDENNRLKGEQGKPTIKASKKREDHSSEKERGAKKERPKRKKRRPHREVVIDREEKVKIPVNELPADAEFKGYEAVVVQDLVIRTDNIRFLKEKWYSASEQRSYIAELPAGYEGQFGPTVRSLVVTLYYAGGMSEPKIIEFVEQMGVNLSKGIVSAWLSRQTEEWQTEADEILRAGLSSSSWQHIDDTSTRVDGVNSYCHILCNPFYTAYATRRRKDRLTLVAVLQNSEQAVYLYTEETKQWLTTFAVPQWAQRRLQSWPQARLLSEAEVTALLAGELSERLTEQQLARLREAGALTAYNAQDRYPVIPILVSDDAPQFRYLTKAQMLCWVHEGRHYKKLTPHVAYHQQILADFQQQFWDYYHRLQAYRADPDPDFAQTLRDDFDTLFSQTTDYEQLNARLAKTLAHKERLLLVLDQPEVPLHNNPAELGARQRVRKRDVSFGPRSESGRVAWDTFMTVAETAKKLGVSFYQYVWDRVSQTNEMPSLADIIRSRGQPVPP